MNQDKDKLIDKLSIKDLTDEQLSKLTFDTMLRYLDVDERVKVKFENGLTKVEDLGMVSDPYYFIRYFQKNDPNIMQKVETIALQANKSEYLDTWVDHCSDLVALHYVDLALKEGKYNAILRHECKVKQVFSFEDARWLDALRVIDKHGPKGGRKDILRFIIVKLGPTLITEACDIISKQSSNVPASYMLTWRSDIPSKYHESFARSYSMGGGKTEGTIMTQIHPDIITKLPAIARLNFLEKAISGPYPFTEFVDKDQVGKWIFATTFKYNDITSKVMKKFDITKLIEEAKIQNNKYGYPNTYRSYGNSGNSYQQTWFESISKPKYVPSVEINDAQE